MSFKHYLLALAVLIPIPASASVVLGYHSEEPAPQIAELLSSISPKGENIEIKPFANVDLLNQAIAEKKIDLAILEEPTRSLDDVTMLSELYPVVLHILYRGEVQPDSIKELLSLGPIWAGPPGGLGYQLAQGLASDYELSTIDLLPDPWAKEPSVYFIFGGLLASDALSRLDGFHLYSIDSPETLMHGSIVEGIVLRYPNLHPFILPAELYPGLAAEPALTLAVNTLLVSHDELDDRIAYELALGSNRLISAIAATYPLAGLPQLQQNAGNARALPWHRGAQRFLDRELPSFLERYAELFGVVLTLFIAAGSLLVALLRTRKQARKDRLDAFYQRVLDCRVGDHRTEQERAEAIRTIRAIQQQVFELVINERIDADAALVAFLSLSNQLLAEASQHPLPRP